MNKVVSTMTFALVMILMIGAASANTIIAGKIYTADYQNIVEGATVDVTCGLGEVTETVTTESLGDGTYSVSYLNENLCHEGSDLSVHAYKEGVGENTVTGTIYDNYPVPEWNLNLGVVNVPLVPEFGALVGALTVLGALGVFFIVRRK